jgi:DNA adenine methylase
MASIRWNGAGRWIEPFLGSGVVLFNIDPRRALVSDTNEHIIRLYESVQAGRIRSRDVRQFLSDEGALLRTRGEAHYYAIRDRFNKSADALDFLFLNRSCFNGLIRFNRKREFNVPFCRKNDRFREAYITKITNQVAWLEALLPNRDWVFTASGWQSTLECAREADFVYVDPPYVGRHTDYFDSWDSDKADALAHHLKSMKAGFAYSMWLKNRFRENEHIARHFDGYPMVLHSHFYHVGATEEWRNEMIEAVVIKPGCEVVQPIEKSKRLKQSELFA